MFEHLDVDDTELPAIHLAPPDVNWDEIYDHIKISHSPMLVLPQQAEEYVGAWWTGTEMVVTEEFGPDQDEALDDFRQYLRDHGQM